MLVKTKRRGPETFAAVKAGQVFCFLGERSPGLSGYMLKLQTCPVEGTVGFVKIGSGESYTDRDPNQWNHRGVEIFPNASVELEPDTD